MALIKRNQGVIWSDARKGMFKGMSVMGVGRWGAEDGTVPGAGREQSFVQNVDTGAELLVAAETPPSAIPNMTLNFVEQYSVNQLRKALREGRKVFVQTRWHSGGALDNPRAWDKIMHWGLGTGGDDTHPSANIDYSGSEVRGSIPMSFQTAVELFRPVVTAQDPPNLAVDNNDVIFVNNLFPDIVAYPGPDQIGFIAQEADSGAAAKILYTSNAGGAWANMSADPFGNDVDIVALAYRVIKPEEGVRIVALSGSTSLAYADVKWGDPGTASWTTVTVTGNGTALAWGVHDELLIATSSGLYISEDAGETVNGTALSSNTNITGIKYVNWPQLDNAKYFIFGASNTLLLKKVGSNTITTLTGPSGGGAFGAVEQCLDGTVWAGNGTKLFRSNDEGVTAAGWTEAKDFGTNFAAVGIAAVKGDPYMIKVAVDNTASPNDGAFHISIDGFDFEKITVLANDGYNAMYQSPHDSNFCIAVGKDDTTEPSIHKLAPV
jgi:hypothetical protein